MENKVNEGINPKINRRDFLKILGAGSIAATAALAGCKPKNTVSAEGGTIGEVPTDKMTYRSNPNNGDKVSLLGYGCMRWPMRTNDKGEEEIDQETVNELVDYAIAHGVNYFDTAPVYLRGWSETATGIALKRHSRDKFFIATKLSNHHGDRQSFQDGVNMYHKSLRDLQVDYIDYYLLHNVGKSVEIFENRFIKNGLLDFLLKEREAGRIRNLGWSFHGVSEVFDHVLNLGVKWDFCMIQLNYQDWQHADPSRNVNAEYLYGELTKKNVPVVIMEPLLGGRLARVNSQALKLMQEMHPEDSAAKWAFRYAGTPPNVLTVLSGMVYMEHLQENIKTYAPLVPINEEEQKVLDKVTDILVNSDYVQCTDCQYCMPCPYGLDIPGVFKHYNRIVNDGNMLKTSNDEHYKEARKAFLVGYDRSVPKLRQASHCIDCNICKPLCPQAIDIPSEMKRIDMYAERLKQNLEF
ncbi:MAG: aldo/keto reductase [Bacteroidales bacterium]|jgi:predicted aldo/keto reductase-like oxidoreductase|nr:aldo/keto reductase [Bacteroidales bacterium]